MEKNHKICSNFSSWDGKIDLKKMVPAESALKYQNETADFWKRALCTNERFDIYECDRWDKV